MSKTMTIWRVWKKTSEGSPAITIGYFEDEQVARDIAAKLCTSGADSPSGVTECHVLLKDKDQ